MLDNTCLAQRRTRLLQGHTDDHVHVVFDNAALHIHIKSVQDTSTLRRGRREAAGNDLPLPDEVGDNKAVLDVRVVVNKLVDFVLAAGLDAPHKHGTVHGVSERAGAKHIARSHSGIGVLQMGLAEGAALLEDVRHVGVREHVEHALLRVGLC